MVPILMAKAGFLNYIVHMFPSLSIQYFAANAVNTKKH